MVFFELMGKGSTWSLSPLKNGLPPIFLFRPYFWMGTMSFFYKKKLSFFVVTFGVFFCFIDVTNIETKKEKPGDMENEERRKRLVQLFNKLSASLDAVDEQEKNTPKFAGTGTDMDGIQWQYYEFEPTLLPPQSNEEKNEERKAANEAREKRIKNVTYLVDLKLSVADVRELWRNYGLSTVTRNLVCQRLEDVSLEQKSAEELAKIASHLEKEEATWSGSITF
jgi:hypothetical protein